MSMPGTLRLLADFGPMTAVEMAELLGITPQHAAANCCRLAINRSARSPRRVHIERWQFDHPGQNRYPRPVWALGDLPNASKPPRTEYSRQRHAASYHLRKGRSVSSVFDLGLLVRDRIAGVRAS